MRRNEVLWLHLHSSYHADATFLRFVKLSISRPEVRVNIGITHSATSYTAFLSLFLDAFLSIGGRLRKSTRVTMSNSGGEVKVGGEGISLKRPDCLVLKLDTPKGG